MMKNYSYASLKLFLLISSLLSGTSLLLAQPDKVPGPVCGVNGTLSERIADCDKSYETLSGGRWSVLTRLLRIEKIEDTGETKEFLQDELSGLVWSPYIRAALVEFQLVPIFKWGNLLTNRPKRKERSCSPHADVRDCWAAAKQLCREYESVYDPELSWSLPTKEQFIQAHENGFRHVFPRPSPEDEFETGLWWGQHRGSALSYDPYSDTEALLNEEPNKELLFNVQCVAERKSR